MGLGRVYFRSSQAYWSDFQIHFHKEVLSILLRHLRPPYIRISFFSVRGFGSVCFSSNKCILSSFLLSIGENFFLSFSPTCLSLSVSSIFSLSDKLVHLLTSSESLNSLSTCCRSQMDDLM